MAVLLVLSQRDKKINHKIAHEVKNELVIDIATSIWPSFLTERVMVGDQWLQK